MKAMSDVVNITQRRSSLRPIVLVSLAKYGASSIEDVVVESWKGVGVRVACRYGY